jgi:hypothetical protein
VAAKIGSDGGVGESKLKEIEKMRELKIWGEKEAL